MTSPSKTQGWPPASARAAFLVTILVDEGAELLHDGPSREKRLQKGWVLVCAQRRCSKSYRIKLQRAIMGNIACLMAAERLSGEVT